MTPPLRVAAASDLAFALPALAAAYEKDSGQAITISLGSTGQFAKQIIEGAPYDVFAAANVSFVDDVVRVGACDGHTKAIYGRGRIVMWSNPALGIAPPADLRGLLTDKIVKVAIANPEHAPYGRAAEQAMRNAGVWDALRPKLVYAENIQQALQFAQSGNAEVALVALALAVASPDGAHRPVDARLHDPIDQAAVACGQSPERAAAARSFVAFMASPAGRSIMKRFGFALPGES